MTLASDSTETIECAHCGSETPKIGRYGSVKKYCGPDCKEAARVERRKALRDTRRPDECACCGGPIPDLGRKKTAVRKYCSDYCRYWMTHSNRSYAGLTLREVREMERDQNGRCKICQEETKLVVDHNHDTGEIRGLLCELCNKGIGLLRESVSNLESAILYLS